MFHWLIGNILCYCEFEIAHTLVRCVLEFWCGWVGVVSVWQAETQLAQLTFMLKSVNNSML